MGSSDITNSIIIVVVFAIINLIAILSISIAQIKKNWEYYKCKPIIIPFASVFGKDTSKNFKECIQNIETSFLSEILGPIYKIFAELNAVGGEIGTFITKINSLGSMYKLSFLTGITDMKELADKSILGISNLGVKFSDIIAKVSGIMFIIIQILEGVNITAVSIVCGLPGQLVKVVTGTNPCPLSGYDASCSIIPDEETCISTTQYDCSWSGTSCFSAATQ